MALKTLGSNATNSLNALVFGTNLSAADMATLQQSIKDDKINGNPIYPGAMSSNGTLYIPNRGLLQVLPGDYVGVDANGWPILLSSATIAATGWTHS